MSDTPGNQSAGAAPDPGDAAHPREAHAAAPPSSPIPAADAGAGTLAGNVVTVALAVFVSNGLLLLSDLAVVRWYGKGFHGSLMWLISVTRLTLLGGSLGLFGTAGIRHVARGRARLPHAVSDEISERLTLAFLSLTVCSLAVLLLARPIAAALGRGGSAPEQAARWLRIATTWILLLGGLNACRMIAVGYERMDRLLLMVSADEGGKLAWVAVAAGLSLSAGWVVLGWTGVHAIALLLTTWLIARMGRGVGLRVRPKLAPLRRSLRIALDGVAYLAPTLWHAGGMQLVLMLLVGLLRPAGDVSVVRICLTWSLVSRLLVAPLSTALLPRVAWTDAADDSAPAGEPGTDLSATLAQAARMLGLVGSLAFACLWAVGPVLLRLYGPEYREALSALLVFALAVGLDNYGQMIDRALLGAKGLPIVLWTELLKYAALLGGVWLLVPDRGALGAAEALSVAMAVNIGAKLAAVAWLAGRAGPRALTPSRLGAGPFVCSLGVFALIAAAALAAARLDGAPARIAAPLASWAVGVLALRVLRPREALGWARTVLRLARRAAD